jgi:DNA-binding GntR family transcriptional regulator
LLNVRELLESETARLAARSPARDKDSRLRAIWDDGHAAANNDDVARAVAANNAFHAEVAAIAGNSVLADLAGIVGRRVRWYYRLVAPARGHGSWAEHAELMDAIVAGDEERAILVARKHTERTRNAYRSLLSP